MPLTRSDLLSLEEYSIKRAEIRAEVIAHKKLREVCLNQHARLLFEDETTIRYQIQEMLRIEKVFEAEGIQEELDAYNPLIPDGHNLKATFMLEYDDVEERRKQLEGLIGVEDQVWLQVGDQEKVYPIADEDMDRENEVKTSSVHFLRFELSAAMIKAARSGSEICFGCDHPNMLIDKVCLSKEAADSLASDLKV